MKCERCGFEAIDQCQIDGHHKDRNRKNNSKDNIESVCAMCHRMIHKGLEHLILPMDTTQYDEKMNEYRKQAAVGVPFPSAARNAEIKPVEHDPILHLVNCNKESENELKGQIQALLEDISKLTKERDELLVKRENWTRATESDKVRFWINRHDQLKASLVKGEYDQSV